MDRIRFAMDTAGLSLPDGKIALFGALSDEGLGDLSTTQVEVIQDFYPEFAQWERRVPTTPTPAGPYSAAIVTLPRARDLAQARIALAAQHCPDGLIIVNGAKTDGIEPIAKALKKKLAVLGQVSKAHGRCLWFQSSDALEDWRAPRMSRNAEGDFTAPGVFSASASDPASKMLAQALPDTLKGRFADLGAGWGWLSREILKRDGIKDLHMVEANLAALECAKENVKDARAHYHWADATRWSAPTLLDGVIMNPPFHTGRKGDPSLGQAFISSAARLLAPHGQLWLVANRHLPYEASLEKLFREIKEISGNTKFKVLHASRPSRSKR